MTIPLINKYRPQTFDEVIGNSEVVKALATAIASNSAPHAFLFVGPSGTGKTTLARIVASVVNATVDEIDAASNSGIDDTRRLVDASQYQPLSGLPNKMVIIDEAQNLSPKGWQPLLKLIEEPPNYLYIALCTTDPGKVPDAIKTRTYPVGLKILRQVEIEDLVALIAELENWKLTNDVFAGIVQAATGQPRKALTILQAGHGCVTKEELSRVIVEVERESDSLTELCRYMLKGGKDWGMISALLLKLEDDEDTLAQANRYLFKAMANAGSEGQAQAAWKILDALSFPRTSWDKKVTLATAIGSILWG